MIIDGEFILIPGNRGKDCPGNWESANIYCCCDECSHLMCCLDTHDPKECLTCDDKECPRSPNCHT